MTKFLDATGITRLVGGIIDRKEYQNLETTNKTISGAINELKNSGGGGGTLPEEYYSETYQKIQVSNSLDWTQIPSNDSTIADSSSVSLETVAVDDPSYPVEILYISDKNEVDSNGYPHYKIWIGDKIWKLYTSYDEYTEETPVINEEDFTDIYDQDTFDAIIDSFGTHTENQSFQQKFAAEKLTAGEGIIIDNQNKINSSLVGEVLSKSWTETDLGIDLSEVYWDEYDINMNNWVLVKSSSSSYYIINFKLGCTGYIEDYDTKYLELKSYDTITWYVNETEDDSFSTPSNSDINYYGIYPYFVQNGSAYSITSIYNDVEGNCHIYLEELVFSENISPNATASVFYGNYSFIYDDNESKYYRCLANNSEQNPEEITFVDENGDNLYPSFLSYSYLYKWQNNIYLYDSNHDYDGLIYYFNTENDITEDLNNTSVEIVLHEISLGDLGFNFDFADSYAYTSFFNSGLFAQSFWRKKINKEENYELVEDIDEFYFDYRHDSLYSEDKEFHYQLNKQTGLWEARIYGIYFLGNGGGYGVFPNRLAIEALELTESPYSFLYPDSYFYGPIKNTTETGGESDASSWDSFFVLTFQKTSENLIPNIHIYEHPEFQVQSKLKSESSFIKIQDLNKIVFNPQDILRNSNLYVDWGTTFEKDDQNFNLTVKATRSFQQNYWSCIALSSGIEYQGTLTFTFVKPIESTQQLLDNVKVYFKVTSNSVSAYCVYAGIGDIKPKISYKKIPINELSQITYSSALSFQQNDRGNYETEVLCFRVDLETYDGVSSDFTFYDKFPAEENKFFEGMVEVNTTDTQEEYVGFFCKPLRVPNYYEQINSGTYQYYATPKQKYLPYMRDTNSISSHDDPVVIYDNLVDSNTGDPIPNPDYVNYDNIWTEVTEKQGLPI